MLKRLSFALDVDVILSEFNYCPLVWGFSSRTSIAKVDHLPNRVNPCKSEASHEDVHSKHCRFILEEVPIQNKKWLEPHLYGKRF